MTQRNIPPTQRAFDGMVESAIGLWSTCANLADLWWTRHGGMPSRDIAGHRLQALLRFARAASPFYRELYARLPHGRLALRDLPVVDKRQLMARFDDWVTNPRITIDGIRRFVADRRKVGERFLGRYWIWKSSGTSGFPGLFVQDSSAMAVYDALVTVQLDGAPWGTEGPARLVAAGGRAALVVATGDHFASVSSWERLRHAFPGLAARSFSVLDPLPRLVDDLNGYNPGFLAGYPSILALLANERAEGRLGISPALLWSGGEHLAPAAQDAIERAFGCPVMQEYGASECLSIAYACREGWLHVNSEWCYLEGVDADGQPTPPGEVSHTVLLTNLANWIQPVIRYDLGDRIVACPAPCRCGSPLPAFRIEGRTDDVLRLRSRRGAAVPLTPLALSTVVEDVVGNHRFQIAQTARDRLALRFEPRRGGRALEKVRSRAASALKSFLDTQSLPDIELVQDPKPPRVDRPSGKLRTVVIDDGAETS